MLILETPRLTLSRLTLQDAPFIVELLNSEAWLRYIGDREIYGVEAAENYLKEKVFPGYENGGLAGWKVTEKSSGKPIGNCGFYQRDFLDYPDLGFAFLPQYIRKGFGYEAASHCLRFGQEQLGLKRCAAFTTTENVASIALLEKLGFQKSGFTNWPGDDAQMLLFDWSA